MSINNGTTAPRSIDSILGSVIVEMAERTVDAKCAEYIAKLEEAAARISAAAPAIQFQVGGVTLPPVTGAHAALADVARRLAWGGRNLLLVGPTGSGKSTLGEHVAAALGRPAVVVSCHAGMDERDLLGDIRHNITAGTTNYRKSPLVEGYEAGAVLVLDEMDTLDPSVALALNAGLASDSLPVTHAGYTARRHENTIIIGTANTYGTGPTAQYCGRAAQDAAFLNRWDWLVYVDYDARLERALADAIAPDHAAALMERTARIRKRITDTGARQNWTTRQVIRVALACAADADMDEAIRQQVIGWQQDARLIEEAE